MHGNDIGLFLVGIIAIFRDYKLTAGSGKKLEEIFHDFIVRLKQTIKAFARDFKVLSIGFNRNHERRQQELSKKKQLRENIMLELWYSMFFVLRNCNSIKNMLQDKQ